MNHLDQILAKKTVTHDIDTMKECIIGITEKKLREDKEEEAERQKRVSGVIVHGNPESKKESEQRVEEDESTIAEVINILKLEATAKQVIRLERKEESKLDKPRKIKFVLESEEVGNTIFKEATNLRQITEGLDKVYIHPDLTPMKREQRKELLAILQERQDKGEKNLMIFQGKIVERRTQDRLQR